MSKYKYIKPRHYKNITTNTKDKGENAMKNNDNLGTRFLAKGVEVSNDTHATLLNNNDVIIGASGCGKTTSYVYGNIAGMYGSYVIADTKGNLAKKFGPMLRKAGYDVQVMDFVDIERSAGYNPMDYIKRHFDGKYSEQDVQKLAELISPVKSIDDPYWETSAKNLICALIALVMETEPHEKQNLSTVGRYASSLGFLQTTKSGAPVQNAMRKLHDTFIVAHNKNPDSFAWRKYSRFTDIQQSEKTWACIINFASKALTAFDMCGFDKMFTGAHKIDLRKPGKTKCAYFVNVSDVDRSMDSIANIFYSQIFQALISEADNNINSRLNVPVRFILDDFATNVYIPDFDKIISVIRSREISVSIILQSITQLDALYGSNRARTIINNCDHLLYIGGHDYKTASYISDLANVPLENVIDMPADKQYILTRGHKPIYANRLAPDAMAFEEETDKPDGPDEPDNSDKPEVTDLSAFRSIPKPVKDTMGSDSVVIENIPKSLVCTYGHAGRRICKLSFAYKKEGYKILYAMLRVPETKVKLDGEKYTFDLGSPTTTYICEISGSQDTVPLTAKEIKSKYNSSRVWYITYIKKRTNAASAPKG